MKFALAFRSFAVWRPALSFAKRFEPMEHVAVNNCPQLPPRPSSPPLRLLWLNVTTLSALNSSTSVNEARRTRPPFVLCHGRRHPLELALAQLGQGQPCGSRPYCRLRTSSQELYGHDPRSSAHLMSAFVPLSLAALKSLKPDFSAIGSLISEYWYTTSWP